MPQSSFDCRRFPVEFRMILHFGPERSLRALPGSREPSPAAHRHTLPALAVARCWIRTPDRLAVRQRC